MLHNNYKENSIYLLAATCIMLVLFLFCNNCHLNMMKSHSKTYCTHTRKKVFWFSDKIFFSFLILSCSSHLKHRTRLSGNFNA
jgi:hypothetical protein